MARQPAVRRARSARKKTVRYAVIGLGHIAQAAVLPAFKHARRNSTLAALVSGERKKLIALPNNLHKEFTVRAARAGLHGGEEGLADLRVIEGMLRSTRTGKPVALKLKGRPKRPTMRQEIRRPAVPREPKLVDVKSASQ